MLLVWRRFAKDVDCVAQQHGIDLSRIPIGSVACRVAPLSEIALPISLLPDAPVSTKGSPLTLS
jgi:hypothetical protein